MKVELRVKKAENVQTGEIVEYRAIEKAGKAYVPDGSYRLVKAGDFLIHEGVEWFIVTPAIFKSRYEVVGDVA